MKTEIKIFATHNSTAKWAIVVDERIGLYDSQAEADRVYTMIGGDNGSDGLSGTPFGSCQLIPPRHECNGCSHASHSDIADFVAQASDIESYVADALTRKPDIDDRPVYDMDDTLGLFV